MARATRLAKRTFLWARVSFVFLLLQGESIAAPSSTELTIAFLEKRLQGDPDDFVAAGKLGGAYLQLAREQGFVECFAKAERSLTNALKWEPDSVSWRASLGTALAGQHRFGEAAAIGRKLVAEFPREASGYAVLGDALLELGDVSGAESAYGKLASILSGPGTAGRLARVAWLRGDVSAARSNWTAAIAFSNSPPELLAWAHVQRGQLLFRTGQTNAQHEYELALQILPGYYAARDHLAECRAARGDFETARKMFEDLATQTRRPEYLQAVGDVLLAARQPDEAARWHDRALAAYLQATEQGSVAWFHHLAGFHCDSRENGLEAEKWARRDLEVRQNVSAWDVLAWALFVKKDYAGALDAMKKALALGTRDAHVLAHAGSIFVRAGKISEGREFMKQAAQANPHYGDFHLHR